jgi:glycerol kinase
MGRGDADLFQIPRQALAEIRPSSGLFGYTKGLDAIPDGIPVMAMIGDSHAALFAHGLGAAGCVKATYGTGSSVMAPVVSAQCDVKALATTVAWHDGERLVYGLEGNIPHTGDAVAWMAESTGLNTLPEAELAQALNTLPASVESTLGVYFVPALTGLGAPWWDEDARADSWSESWRQARASGSRSAGVHHLSNCRCSDCHAPARRFCLKSADGRWWPHQNDWLMQYQADLLGCPVMRSDVPELSAMGAALLARKALVQVDTEQLRQYLPEHMTFIPDDQRHGRLQKRWHEWQSAVQLARTQKPRQGKRWVVGLQPDTMICGDCSPQKSATPSFRKQEWLYTQQYVCCSSRKASLVVSG